MKEETVETYSQSATNHKEYGSLTLSSVIRKFREAGIEDAAYEAKALFTRFGGFEPYNLVFGDPECSSPELFDAVNKRLERIPFAYVVGDADFYRETYKVSPAVLVPRQDTEVLVDFAVGALPIGARFMDICTGSGCIAISTLNNTQNTTAVAVDISSDALMVAEKNRVNILGSRKDDLTLVLSDALTYQTNELFDAILSNPPYIAGNVYQTLQKEVKHEPKIALVGGGDDGGDFYRDLTAKYKSNLKDTGFIAYEIGYDQGELLCNIAKRENMSCEIIKDLSGNDRVAVLRKNK